MVKRIVLTGGPGSGKTTSIRRVVTYFEGLGYNVVVVPETATELILGGLRPFGDNAMDMVNFQELVLRLQLAKESVFEKGVEFLPNKDTLIIYDRGLIDNRSYVSALEFEMLVKTVGCPSYEEMMGRYDAVICLETPVGYYRTDNNEARSESVDGAVVQGRKTMDAWMAHSNMYVVLPQENFQDKIDVIIDYICKQLNTVRMVKQRKYLIDLGDCGVRKYMDGVVLDIEQMYLRSDEHVEKRLRKVECEGRVSYYLSVFKLGEEGKTVISDEVISRGMYDELKVFKDDKRGVLKKRRYITVFGDVKYSLDVFEDCVSTGIMEVSSQSKCVFDSNSSYVLEDVSNDERYQNRNLAVMENRQLLFR